jgi:hypothetical protein
LLADPIWILAVPPSTVFQWLFLLPNKCSVNVEGYFEHHASIRILWNSSRVERFQDSYTSTCTFCFGIFTTLCNPY